MPEEGKQIAWTSTRIQGATPLNLFGIQAGNSRAKEYGHHRLTWISDSCALSISQEILKGIRGCRPSLELKDRHVNWSMVWT
jgi:hypothetical protein